MPAAHRAGTVHPGGSASGRVPDAESAAVHSGIAAGFVYSGAESAGRRVDAG
jgi:hypothetical protein